MKAQFFLLVAVMVFGMVHAQQCYHCSSYTSKGDTSAFDSIFPEWPACDENYQESTFNCSQYGGCQTTNFDYEFNVEGKGRVSVSHVTRSCGEAENSCMNSSYTNPNPDENQGKYGPGVTLVSRSGNVCFCSENLCNGAPAKTLRLGALPASLLVSYLAMKW